MCKPSFLSLVTSPACRVVLSAVAPETACRVDPSVYSVLKDIIAAMGKPPLRRIRMLVAWLQFLFVGMAVDAKGDLMTCIAELDCL